MKNRFRKILGKILVRLKILRYTIKNVRNNRNSEDYIQQIIINKKNIKIIIIKYVQILTVYEYINPKLRVILSIPTDVITVNNFIN